MERPEKMTRVPVSETLEEKMAAFVPGINDGAVGLVLTGGTIGAFEEDSVLSVGGQAEGEANVVDQLWPGLGARTVVRSPLRKLSENFEPRDWLAISAAVRDLVNADAVAGTVILHGTDTMSYTAAALSFLLADLEAPVVLTGSNFPSHHPDSDALHNVRDALVALGSLKRGVYVAFAGGTELPSLVHLGTRVRKERAADQAFFSVNREPVGMVRKGVFRQLEPPHLHEVASGFAERMDDRVLSVRLYPGLDFDALLAAVRAGDTRAVLVELYASATGPDTRDRFSLPAFIRSCAELGVLVATTVSNPVSRHAASVYETTLAIEDAGAMFLRDMIPEAAVVKLMWALAQEAEPQQVRDLMLTPIAGEISRDQ
jgi:L-asparaginase type I